MSKAFDHAFDFDYRDMPLISEQDYLSPEFADRAKEMYRGSLIRVKADSGTRYIVMPLPNTNWITLKHDPATDKVTVHATSQDMLQKYLRCDNGKELTEELVSHYLDPYCHIGARVIAWYQGHGVPY